jgi:hypothetical protein
MVVIVHAEGEPTTTSEPYLNMTTARCVGDSIVSLRLHLCLLGQRGTAVLIAAIVWLRRGADETPPFTSKILKL